MTARLSIGNTGFRTYLFHRLSEMKSRFIALCLMSLFSFPLLSLGLDLIVLSETERRKGPRPGESNADLEIRMRMIYVIGTIIITAACVMLFVLFLQGLFTAKASMRRLWNRKYTDMDMSLPVSADTRFLGDITSGFTVYFLPQLIAAGLALLVLLPADGMIAQMRQILTANSSDSGTTVDFFRGILGYLLSANMMQYFFSLMIISFCGRKLTANIVPFIFGLGIPCMTFFLCVITGVNCYGTDLGELMYGPFWDCTPVGMILSSFTMYPSQYGGLYHDLSWLRAILYSAVFAAAAYFMIKHRREERTGSAFVYKACRYVTESVIILTSASVIYLAALHDQNLRNSLYGVAGFVYRILSAPTVILVSAWLIINLIIFVTIELVSREKLGKPKRLALAAARFALSAGVSFLICFGFYNSDGFGAANYIPAVSDIGRIELMSYGPDMVFIDHYAEVTDEESIKLVTDLHRRILTERPVNADDAEYQCFHVRYCTRNGKEVSRNYYLPTEYTRDCMELWFKSGAFANTYTSRMPAGTELYKFAVKVVDPTDENRGNNAPITTDITCEEFLTALGHDSAKTTYDDIFRHDGANFIYVDLIPENSIASRYQFEVWDTFEETRELLKKHNCDFFDAKTDCAEKYFMYKATSVGNYTTQKKLIRTFDDYGNPATADEPREYHVIDDETAKALLRKSAVMTAYAESRDIYIIIPSYKFRDDSGASYYDTGLSGSFMYYVTEANCDEAAEVYANAPAATEEELSLYIPNYSYEGFIQY